ncbi:MAG: Cleavage polyadenylation factor subunit clp1 [Phylliscum demangeonii]|nr:MAG: Cleavage polyadenylation factor subunit clp1 [Phylliscum demangeonii]
MSLPGLQLSAPAEPAAPTIHVLERGSEWRFEVAFGRSIEVKLLAGTAELFGTELAPKQSYRFSGTKAAIYTWHGCRLEVSGGGSGSGNGGSGSDGNGACQVSYTSDETTMVSALNLHFALERLRQSASGAGAGREGPRVVVVGPENAGKTTLIKILTGYGTKLGRRPVLVNLDSREGLLSLPGSLTATSFASVVDVEDGWGASPISGPSPVPVKWPLVYFYGLPSPDDQPARMYKPITSRLALAVTSKLAEDDETRVAGCLIDTPSAFSQGKDGYDLIQHVVSEFSVNVIVVLGSERLWSDMLRRFDGRLASTSEAITVVKVAKSGGCVDRDEPYLKQQRQAQIRDYFFGDDYKRTLSPHTQLVDWSQLVIYKIHQESAFLAALLPGGHDDPSHDGSHAAASSSSGDAHANGAAGASPGSAPRLFDKVVEPTVALQNCVLAIMHASAGDAAADIRDAPVLGFVYVAEVDEKRRKVKILSPVPGRLPARPLLWGCDWPEPAMNLVG